MVVRRSRSWASARTTEIVNVPLGALVQPSGNWNGNARVSSAVMRVDANRSINAAREVWVVAAGEEKAAAARMALAGAGATAIPAAGVRGRSRTLWLLDRAAASKLPPALARLASP